MNNFRKYLPYILIIFAIILIAIVLYLTFVRPKHNVYLKVAFLDIGQGDAIYIEAPNGKQMLVDAGPGPVVLQKLAEVMPFADRSLDMLVMTNPDKDHIGGFVDVLSKYKVGYILEPGTPKSTLTYEAVEKSITKNNVRKEIARKGMHIILDKEKNIYFDILFPDRDVSDWSPNDGSIVGKLVYGEQSFMLTGDATKLTEYLLMESTANNNLEADVLKLGHHGSHTSSSRIFLEKVKPKAAIISAGKKNRYGHPHQETLDALSSLNISFLATYQKGTIIFKTDGVKLFR